MIGRLNHVAIAVRDIAKAAKVYRDTLGAEVSGQGAAARARRLHRVHHAAQHQDRTAGAARRKLADRQIPRAAIPTAASITSATRWPTSAPRATRSSAQGARVLGDGEPKIGAHGKPVLFLHPKDFCGTLVELEQA